MPNMHQHRQRQMCSTPVMDTGRYRYTCTMPCSATANTLGSDTSHITFSARPPCHGTASTCSVRAKSFDVQRQVCTSSHGQAIEWALVIQVSIW